LPDANNGANHSPDGRVLSQPDRQASIKQERYAIAALTVESSASLEQFFERTGIPVPKLTGRGPTDVHTTAGSDLVLALRRKRLYMMVPDVPSSSTSKTTQSGLSLAIWARLSAQVLAVLTR